MHRDISFWLAIVAIIAFAVGTLPTAHGLFCWGFGTVLVVALRYRARFEGKRPF